MTARPLPADLDAFFADLTALTRRVYADRQPEDVRHFRRIQAAGRLCSAVGYAAAWLGPNPIAVLGIALGMSCRWMIVAHHVLHRGYDAYARTTDGPARKPSAEFGRGVRRFVDWCDWIPVDAWKHEHNTLHHYRLGEAYHDPDVPETNLAFLANARLPHRVKVVLLALMALAWKWGYYGPSVLQAHARKPTDAPRPYDPLSPQVWSPLDPIGRKVWRESWLPHAVVRFGILPALFLPLGRAAWLAVLVNSVLADLVTNLHSFCMVLPNHAGADLYRFRTAPANRNELRLRQIVGSVNYRTGGDLNDFLHGWLNYQIEHHLWPDLSLRQYQRWQPELRALCERHGVPYAQESVFSRVAAMARNVTGATRMIEVESLAPSDGAHAPARSGFPPSPRAPRAQSA